MEFPTKFLYTSIAILSLLIGLTYMVKLYYEHQNLKKQIKSQYEPLLPTVKPTSPKRKTTSFHSISPIKTPSSTISPGLVKIIGKITKIKTNPTSTPKPTAIINENVKLGKLDNEPSIVSIDKTAPLKRHRHSHKPAGVLNKTVARLANM